MRDVFLKCGEWLLPISGAAPVVSYREDIVAKQVCEGILLGRVSWEGRCSAARFAAA